MASTRIYTLPRLQCETIFARFGDFRQAVVVFKFKAITATIAMSN